MYALQRATRSIRASEVTNFVKQNFLKQFASLNFSTSIRHDHDTNRDTPGRTGYDASVYQQDTNTSNKADCKDTNANIKIQILDDDILVQKNLQDLDDALIDIPVKEPGPLDENTEDLSHLGPARVPIYNFAKYANESRTIRELVKLGVELYKIEKDDRIVYHLLTSDFDKQIKPYIEFLYHCGLPADRFGFFITKNPKIFLEDMDDLHTRIRYLRAHNFSIQMVKNIVYRNPRWLSFTTKQIDSRLGYFQHTYKLNGSNVRYLASEAPTVITNKMEYLREAYFGVKEEMGFEGPQLATLLLKAPRIWIKARRCVVDTFDYVHNEMNLSHDLILKDPQILLCRKNRLMCRHKFLVHLKKAQYDPLKPMYISLNALIRGSDTDFCINVAKSKIETYNLFLKTF